MNRYVAFCLFGILAFAPLVLPFALSRFRLHSVFGWLISSAALGLLFRPLYLLLVSSDRRADEAMFWRDVPLQDFMVPAAITGLGTFALSVGYLSGRGGRPTRFEWWERRREIDEQLRFVATTVAIVGVVAAVLYVRRTGGFDLGSLSTKRVVVNDAVRASGIQTFGPLLAVGRAGLLGSIVLFHSRKVAGLNTRLAIVLLTLNIFLPFYASDRTGVLLVMLQLLALAGFREGRVDRRRLVIGGVTLLLLLQVLTTLRVSGRSSQDFAFQGPVATADLLVFNRSLFDLSKNLHVVRATGDELEVQYGATFVGAVIGPIPRSIWPSKPLVSVGPQIGRTIYKTPVAGVPPGLLAESYWNFSLPGIVTIGLAAGAFFARLDRLVPERLSPFFQVAFAMLVLPIGYNAVASSVAGVALDLFRDGLTLLFIWVAHRFLASLRHRTPSGVYRSE